MKRLLISSFVALSLSACGGGGDPIADLCAQTYWDGTVRLCVPSNWSLLDRAALEERNIGTPEEVVVVLEADEQVAGFTPRVTVTEESLRTVMTSAEYSAASVDLVQSIPGYRQLDASTMTVGGEEVAVHVFTAQPDDQLPSQRFYQVSAVKDNVGYTVTAMSPLSVTDQIDTTLTGMLRSFSFEAPVVEE